MKTKLDKYFRISQRGSTIGTELIGGATTFATMAYILAYMTGAMSAVPGIDLTGVLLCTALITAISCIAMGLVANAPIALAPVLVIPNLVAGMVASGEATYGQAFGTVAISGIVFLLISVFKLRDLFARSLPKNIKIGIGGAVGLLIASIGLNTSGLAAAGGISPAGTVVFGDSALYLVQCVAFLRLAENTSAPGRPVDPVAGAHDTGGPVGRVGHGQGSPGGGLPPAAVLPGPGAGILPLRCPLPAPAAVQRRSAAHYGGLLELSHILRIHPPGAGVSGSVGSLAGGPELDFSGAGGEANSHWSLVRSPWRPSARGRW